jgi:signal peptide peptidase SppA
MKIFNLNGESVLWAGSEASFDIVVAAQQAVLAAQAAGTLKMPELKVGEMRDSKGFPAIWDKQGSTAIINIAGSMVDGSAGWMRMYAPVIGYDDIAEGAIAAYTDPDIKNVLVRIESPGGQVSGVMDCGELLTQLSKSKPSMVFTSNQMCSGGYWLGTAVQGKIYAGATAEVGSIGVVMVHTDISKALEDQGVKKTVLRSGENKARLNAIEPLTPELKAKVEKDMSDVHNLFRAQVAKGRPGMDAEQLEATTDGSTYRGKRAKSVGLVDGVASFSQALKLLDSQSSSSNTPSNSKGASMKVQLTEAQIAMLATGATIHQLGLSAEDVTKLEAQLAADAAAALSAQTEADKAKAQVQADADAAAAEAAKIAAGGTETSAAVTDLTGKLTASNAMVDLLKSQLLTANAEIITKSAEIQNMKVKSESMTANHEGLLNIARTAVGKMAVALGGSAAAADTMDATAVVAEHTRIDTQFKARFVVGGASKPVTETNTEHQAQVDPQTRAFMATAALAQQSRITK